MKEWSNIVMERNENNYTINSKEDFEGFSNLTNEQYDLCFNFALEMAEGELHREFRTGGEKNRKKNEVFINTLQGKLSEFFVQNVLYQNGITSINIDTGVYSRGEWDAVDLIVNTPMNNTKKITIKSTKNFGNLMLLERNDWNESAEYKHNGINNEYDYFILVRVKFELEKELKAKRMFYSEVLEKEELKKIYYDQIDKNNIQFDIPGFLYKSNIQKVILNRQLIEKGHTLNRETVMDADNYYVQAGNMYNINELFNELKYSY